MNTTLLIVVIAIIVAAAVIAFILLRKRRTAKLRSRFGPEYDRAVTDYGSQSRAEKALSHRTERAEHYNIRALTADEQRKFADDWRATQARFVDDPPLAIREADHLVSEVMRVRGYPMADFDRRAEDLSVDHPNVVRNYRAAHKIAASQQEGRVSTEDLRQAMVYYRDLFDELLEAQPAGTAGRR